MTTKNLGRELREHVWARWAEACGVSICIANGWSPRPGEECCVQIDFEGDLCVAPAPLDARAWTWVRWPNDSNLRTREELALFVWESWAKVTTH